MSGGDSIFPSATKLAAGPVKPYFMAHVVLFFVFCAHEAQIQIDTRLPDAVKIFITDCPFRVKRNSFSSTGNGAPRCAIPELSKLADLTMMGTAESIVSHRTVSFFVHCNEIFTELLLCPPSLRVRNIPDPGANVAGMVTLTWYNPT